MISLLKILLVLVVPALISARNDRNVRDDLIVNPFICTPGSTFKVDCNRCTCGTDRGNVGACTRMGCALEPDVCIPGSYFQIRGYLCRCPECGYKWHSDCFQSNYCNC